MDEKSAKNVTVTVDCRAQSVHRILQFNSLRRMLFRTRFVFIPIVDSAFMLIVMQLVFAQDSTQMKSCVRFDCVHRIVLVLKIFSLLEGQFFVFCFF